MITVVIPYFQKEPGILARALTSVVGQHGVKLPVHVIVVDDASPSPAQKDLDALGPVPFTLELVVQANGGPGAARNTGLDRAPSATQYIAFLDSDDEWSADHLMRAEAALCQGFDFYCADLLQLGAQQTAFVRAGRIDPRQHPVLGGPHPNLHAYQGDFSIKSHVATLWEHLRWSTTFHVFVQRVFCPSLPTRVKTICFG